MKGLLVFLTIVFRFKRLELFGEFRGGLDFVDVLGKLEVLPHQY